VPDPLDPATFERSKLDWAEPGKMPHAALLEVYRRLIALRKEYAELSDPRLPGFRVDVDEQARTIVLHRGRLRVACNLGESGAAIDLAAPLDGIVYRSPGVTTNDSTLVLPAESFAIVAIGPRGRR
jgi:maltooligosyltrehalose trehalohydrolase